MLGPIRFTHIENCAREVCRVFKVEDEMQDCVSMLQSLDDILADLRVNLQISKERTHAKLGIQSRKQDRTPQRTTLLYERAWT